MKRGKMTQVIASVIDSKGRLTIPAKTREQLDLKAQDIVEYKIENVIKKKPFNEVWGKITIKDKRNAVQILHEESPFR